MEDKTNKQPLKTFSLLTNHFHYFLDSVFIVSENGGFRLIVHDRGSLEHNQTYLTDEEAKERFFEIFKFSDEQINETIKPVWSQYSPYQEIMNRTQSLYIKHILEEFYKCCS